MQNKKYNTRIYIDGANLYKALPNIDYVKFMRFLLDKYKPKEVYIFLGYTKKQINLYKFLSNIGYKLIFRETTTDKLGNMKGNCDGELIVKSLEDFYIKGYDRSVLISGDGDFDCLVSFWKRNNINIIVLAPSKKHCSYLFRKNNSIKLTYLDSKDTYKDIQKGWDPR